MRRGDETEKGERGKKEEPGEGEGGGKIKDARERNHADPASLLARLYRVSASRRWSSRLGRRNEGGREEGEMSPA